MAASQSHEDNPWGDDSDDELFLQASQAFEEEQQVRNDLLLKSPTDVNGMPRPPLSAAQAATAFEMRREQLRETSEDPNICSFPPADLNVKQVFSQYQAEKEKNSQYINRLHATQGETENLRRQIERMKQERQEELIKSIQKEQLYKQKTDEERRALIKERNTLQTELRNVTSQLTMAKSKSAFNGSKLSVGGGGASQPVPVPRTGVSSPRPRTQLSAGPRYRSGSDPNLQTPQMQRSVQQPPTTPPPAAPKVETSEKSVTVDESVKKSEEQDDSVFSSVLEKNLVNVHQLDSVRSLEETGPIRQRICNLLKSLIRLDFNEVKPILEEVAKTAPMQIMARFGTGAELRFNVCFPDVTEYMISCGVQAQRKKQAERVGEVITAKYPILPSTEDLPIINLQVFQGDVEEQLKDGGIWAALKEVKRNLKQLLQELNGEKRFQLYQVGNLVALWHLLAWGKHLWGLILIEEELQSVVENVGKELWVNELKEWSGLVLKVDWRDYFAPELESIVRRMSLSILELVITLGYFEESQKRYEILYCIIKDTLSKNHLRSEATLKHILVIVTWTVSENHILNYLCLDKKNKNCLAHILGEAALQFFKETTNDRAATNVLVYYLNLLEILMVKQPYYLYSSKIARPEVTAIREEFAKRLRENLEIKDSSSDGDEENEDKVEAMDVDVDLMSTQFACPDKYRFEDGSKERAEKFNNGKKVRCWINPEEWEVPFGFSGQTEDKPCQCRKLLLGNAFVMLNSVTKFWAKAFLDHEKKVEENQKIDRTEMIFRMETEGMEDAVFTKLSKKRESWREFILEFLQTTRNEKFVDDDDVEQDEDVEEWSWDELLKCQHKTKDELEEETDWTWERGRIDNIFDYVLRQAANIIGFCHDKSCNLALALGSEGFSCFRFLESFFRTYSHNVYMTTAEKRLVFGKGSEDDDDDEDGSGPSIFDVDEDFDHLNDYYLESVRFHPDEILEGLPNYELPELNEEEFERNYRLSEHERRAALGTVE